MPPNVVQLELELTLLDRVARNARSPRDLANGHLIPQRPFPNNPQKSHVYHSDNPQLVQAGASLHMGQFSVKISVGAGSILSGNQQDTAAAKDLADFVERVRPEFPHVEIHALTGSFEDNAPLIDRLATHPFRLVFVDPTGWTGYPLEALKTVCRGRCELILNFMHEHIQRHLYHPSEDRERWLRAIVGDDIAAEFAGRELPAEETGRRCSGCSRRSCASSTPATRRSRWSKSGACTSA